MKKTILMLVGVLSLVLASTVFAAETPKRQKALGGFRTASGSISGAATVTGIGIDCGGSACTGSIYSASETQSPSNARGRFEISAAANATAYVNIDPPLRLKDGVYVVVDTNVDALIVYAESAR